LIKSQHYVNALKLTQIYILQR